MNPRNLILSATAAALIAPIAMAQDAKPKVTAQKLVGKAVEAMGGEALQDKLTLTHSTNMNMGPQSFDATIQMRFPLDVRAEVTVPDMGEAEMCSDGEHLWTKDPGSDEYEVDSPDAAPFSVILTPYTRFGTMMLHNTQFLEYDGLTDFNDAKCHKVGIGEDKGGVIEALYFDAKTGLPSGLTLEGPDGSDANVLFREWGESDGVKMVTLATVAIMGTPVEIKFDDFVWNTVKDEVFAMPEAVKKQIKAAGDKDDAKHTNDDDGVGHSDDEDDDDLK